MNASKYSGENKIDITIDSKNYIKVIKLLKENNIEYKL